MIAKGILRFSLYVGGLCAALILLALLVGHASQANRILFLSEHGDSYKLYGLDLGSGLIAKINDTDFDTRMSYSLSPDGEHVLYLYPEDNTHFGLYTMKLNGTDNRQLPIRTGNPPEWSPDSQSILFARLDNISEQGIQIYRANSDGTSAQQLTQFAKNNSTFLPIWSPDGRHILFQSLVDNREPRLLYVMNADSTALQQIDYSRPFQLIEYARWSPDSRRIAFIARFFNDDQTVLSMALCISETSLTLITCFDNADLGVLTDSALRAIDWSPDSTQIVFGSSYGMNTHSIMTFDVETSTTRLVLRHENDAVVGAIGRLIWTPDGCCLIYEVIGAKGQKIYSAHIDGSQERNLTNDAFSNISPTWWPGK